MNIAHEAISCCSLEKKQTIIDGAIIHFSSRQTEITQMQNEVHSSRQNMKGHVMFNRLISEDSF